MEQIEHAYQMLLWGSVIFIGILTCICFWRAYLGPRFTDRVIAINIINTKLIIMIAVLSWLRRESSLLDISIVYAMVGFLAVVVLSKCYLPLHQVDPARLDKEFAHLLSSRSPAPELNPPDEISEVV